MARLLYLQVSELLEAGRASFLDASTVWEEGIVQYPVY